MNVTYAKTISTWWPYGTFVRKKISTGNPNNVKPIPDWSSCFRLHRNAVKIHHRLILNHNKGLRLRAGGSAQWGTSSDLSSSLLFAFSRLFSPVWVVNTRDCYRGDHNTTSDTENYYYKNFHWAKVCKKKGEYYVYEKRIMVDNTCFKGAMGGMGREIVIFWLYNFLVASLRKCCLFYFFSVKHRTKI